MADLNIGNSTANVIVNVKHNGAVNPQINNTYDLGTSDLRWKNIYGNLKGNASNAHTVDGEHSSAFVHIAGAETVTGTKTFTGNINIAAGAAGGLINGSATNGGLNSIRIGDDVWLGDVNQGGILGLKATNSSTTQNGFWFYNGSGTNIGKLYADGTNLVTNKSFVPESDLSNNLGTTSKEFKELYVRAIAARHLDADRVFGSDHDLYIGYGSIAATNSTKFYYSADNADGVRSRIEYARINNNGLYALTRFGVNGQNTGYNFYVNGTSYQTDIARFVKSSTAAIFGGTLSNISSAIYAPTSGIQLCAGGGGTTSSTAIGFHNPGISSAIFGYYQIDENNGQFRMRSDDTYWDLSLGGTTKLTSQWGKANLVVGENDSDKIVAGYLVGNTNGAVIGANNSALTAWAPLNISGNTINFREGEIIRGKILDGCLSLFPSNSNYREGIRIHSTNFENDSWSDILLCGADNNGDSGRSANSWFLGNNNGNFYITRNGSTSSTASYASVENNYWQFYPKLGINGTNSTYNFYVNGISYFNDNTTHNGIDYFANGTTYYIDNNANANLRRGLFAGTSNSDTTASEFFHTGALEVRESGRVGTAQSSFNYAPRIGFHWSGRIAATLSFHSDGIFYLRKQNGSDRATLDANLNGNADTVDGYHESSFLRYSGWWYDGSGQNVNDASGMIFAYGSHGLPGNWGVVTTFDYSKNSEYRHQIYGDGWNNEMYFRTRSSDRGGWAEWRRLVYESGTWGISISGNANTATRAEYLGDKNSSDKNSANGNGWYSVGIAQITEGNYMHAPLAINWYWGIDMRACDVNHLRINGARVWSEGMSVTGAVWNDYAEYREADTIQGGRCVREVGDDTLSLTTKRLMRGCSITSDTWGFAQGETEKAKTPIAVAGRVLAYPLEDRELFKEYIGYSVCSGPNGTVSLMTEEEELKYPWAIVGTVSAVPDYEEWGGGEMADRPSVKVDGRIWIKVK